MQYNTCMKEKHITERLPREALYNLPNEASITLNDAATYFQCTSNRVGRMTRGEYNEIYLYFYKIGHQSWTTMGSIREYQNKIMEKSRHAQD